VFFIQKLALSLLRCGKLSRNLLNRRKLFWRRSHLEIGGFKSALLGTTTLRSINSSLASVDPLSRQAPRARSINPSEHSAVLSDSAPQCTECQMIIL
jgi:hypothetical protein